MPNVTLELGGSGPVVELIVRPSGPFTRKIAVQGSSHLPEVLWGLIDTGSALTFIDTSVVRMFGLQPIGEVEVRTLASTTASGTFSRFAVRLEFARPQLHLIADSLPVCGANLAPLGIQALIGRDVLSRCILIYNGPDSRFTLAI